MAMTVKMDALSLEAAQLVLGAALARAGEMGKAFCVCVADPAGEPVLAARMDGAPRLSAQIAANKAWTVASFNGMPTHVWWGAIENEPALVHGITHTPRLVVFGGGVPVVVGGAVVGSVGVSGGSADEDRDVAESGAAAVAD